MEMDKYIVIWMTRKNNPENPLDPIEEDQYQVFIDAGSSEGNKQAAITFYDHKKDEDDVYSANLCIIVESTDY